MEAGRPTLHVFGTLNCTERRSLTESWYQSLLPDCSCHEVTPLGLLLPCLPHCDGLCLSPQTVSQDTPFLPHLASCQTFSNSNEESNLHSMKSCSLFFLCENLFWMKQTLILHLPRQSLNSLPAS